MLSNWDCLSALSEYQSESKQKWRRSGFGYYFFYLYLYISTFELSSDPKRFPSSESTPIHDDFPLSTQSSFSLVRTTSISPPVFAVFTVSHLSFVEWQRYPLYNGFTHCTKNIVLYNRVRDKAGTKQGSNREK